MNATNLEKAIEIALSAHAGQKDKQGEPYILHPLRVMLEGGTFEEQIVGVLHDVLEDNPLWDMGRLREAGFSETVLGALEALTRRPGEVYLTEYMPRCLQNKLAAKVKLRDLEDNLVRLPICAETQELGKRYAQAYTYLVGF